MGLRVCKNISFRIFTVEQRMIREFKNLRDLRSMAINPGKQNINTHLKKSTPFSRRIVQVLLDLLLFVKPRVENFIDIWRDRKRYFLNQAEERYKNRLSDILKKSAPPLFLHGLLSSADFWIPARLYDARSDQELDIYQTLDQSMKDGKRCILITGVPGAGKTTLLRHLAKSVIDKHYHSQSVGSFTDKEWLPIWVQTDLFYKQTTVDFKQWLANDIYHEHFCDERGKINQTIQGLQCRISSLKRELAGQIPDSDRHKEIQSKLEEKYKRLKQTEAEYQTFIPEKKSVERLDLILNNIPLIILIDDFILPSKYDSQLHQEQLNMKNFIENLPSQHLVIITGTPEFDEVEFLNWQRFDLLPLTDSKQAKTTFLQGHFKNIIKNDKADQIIEAIYTNSRLSDMTGNPYWLWIVTFILFRAEIDTIENMVKKIHNRCSIYEELFLAIWKTVERTPYATMTARPNPYDAKKIFSCLANEMSKEGRIYFDENELLTFAKLILEEDGDWEKWELVNRTRYVHRVDRITYKRNLMLWRKVFGRLFSVGDETHLLSLLTFMHFGLQEYFTAVFLEDEVEPDEIDLIKGYLAQPKYQESMMMVLLNQKNAPKILLEVLKERKEEICVTDKVCQEHKRRLEKLKEQKAKQGITTDPSVLTEIEDIEKEIDNLDLKKIGTQKFDLDDRPQLLFYLARILRDYQLRFEDDLKDETRETQQLQQTFADVSQRIIERILRAVMFFPKDEWQTIPLDDGLAAGELMAQYPHFWEKIQEDFTKPELTLQEQENIIKLCGKVGGYQAIKLLYCGLENDLLVPLSIRLLQTLIPRNCSAVPFDMTCSNNSDHQSQNTIIVTNTGTILLQILYVADGLIADETIAADFKLFNDSTDLDKSTVMKFRVLKILSVSDDKAHFQKLAEYFLKIKHCISEGFLAEIAVTMISMAYNVQFRTIDSYLYQLIAEEITLDTPCRILFQKIVEADDNIIPGLLRDLSDGNNEATDKLILRILAGKVENGSHLLKSMVERSLLSGNLDQIKLVLRILVRVNTDFAVDLVKDICINISTIQAWQLIYQLETVVHDNDNMSLKFCVGSLDYLAQDDFNFFIQFVASLTLANIQQQI